MLGPVVDLAFSHSTEEAVIGAVDSCGNLFVYKVTEETSGLSTEKLVEVMTWLGRILPLLLLIFSICNAARVLRFKERIYAEIIKNGSS